MTLEEVNRVLDEVRASIAAAVDDRILSRLLIEAVPLVDATARRIKHGLGRKVTVRTSPPRGATSSGRIVESVDGADSRNYVVLTATGYGATITVDVEVY